MTPEKMIAVIETYEDGLCTAMIQKICIDPKRTFASLDVGEMLQHAHFLCDGAKKLARDPSEWGKANRHFAAVQMLLSFAGWYTLEDLMNHNRPKEAAEITAQK